MNAVGNSRGGYSIGGVVYRLLAMFLMGKKRVEDDKGKCDVLRDGVKQEEREIFEYLREGW